VSQVCRPPGLGDRQTTSSPQLAGGRRAVRLFRESAAETGSVDARPVRWCGKDRVLSETHTAHRDMLIRDIIARIRHDGCGGGAGKVELITGIDGASSRPVRKIVLRAE